LGGGIRRTGSETEWSRGRGVSGMAEVAGVKKGILERKPYGLGFVFVRSEKFDTLFLFCQLPRSERRFVLSREDLCEPTDRFL